MLKIKQIIKDKYWIVESGYGKVGTVRKLDNGFEYFNQDNNTQELLPNLESFKETVQKLQINQEYKGFQQIFVLLEDETRLYSKKLKMENNICCRLLALKYDGMGGNTHFV